MNTQPRNKFMQPPTAI